jgi:phage shock protein A
MSRPLTANSAQAYREYQDVSSQIEVLQTEREQLINLSIGDHEELLKRIQQLDSEISAKESVLSDIRGKNPKLREQFAALKRRISETAQATTTLIQQNQLQREQNAIAQQNLKTLKVKLQSEESRMVNINSQLEEIKDLLKDEDLDDETKAILEARLLAAEESFNSHHSEKQAIKDFHAVNLTDAPASPRTPTKEMHLEVIYETEQRIIQSGRHKRTPSSV